MTDKRGALGEWTRNEVDRSKQLDANTKDGGSPRSES